MEFCPSDHWLSFSARKSNNCWDGGEKAFVVIQNTFVEFSVYNNTEVNNYSGKSLCSWLCIFFKANADDWINMVWVLCIYLEHDLRARAYDIDFYFQCIETYSTRILKMKTSHCHAGVCIATFFNVCSSSPTYSLWSKSFSAASLYGS